MNKFNEAKKERAFTLIELLIVIAIIAILGAAILLILNPRELISQANDSQRMTDLDVLSKAIDVYKMDGTLSGATNIVYISIPSSSTDCGYGTGNPLLLPILPTGWTYRCASATDYTKVDGTGWVPLNLTGVQGVAYVSSLPIDPTNNGNSFYQYVVSGNNYSIKAPITSLKLEISGQKDGGQSTQYEKGSSYIAPLTTQDNWVRVPGNPAFGTTDFLTMKYEAKCVSATTNESLTSPSLAGFYDNRTTNCTSGNGRYVASSPRGYPISIISHNQAKTYCTSMGARLMTNDEWMTIARNIESVDKNWSNGSIGSGYLYAGNTTPTETPGSEDLQASSDDNGYYGTGIDSGSHKRTNYLSNGAVIWDIAGQVFEHVMRGVVDDQTQFVLPTCSSPYTNLVACQYGTTNTPYVTNYGTVLYSLIGSSNSAWNSNQGVGSVLIDFSGARPAGTVLVRGGGFFNYAGTSGIYSVFTNQSATADNDIQIGFRCVKPAD